jgi:hypothetical protein
MKAFATKAVEPGLTPMQRQSQILLIVAMLSVFAFFVLHQFWQTGFLTARFNLVEMLALYVPILLALVAPLVRMFTGRYNPARLFEAATNVALAFGSFWLIIIFPFEFAHLADMLPEGIRFVVAWLTNDLGRIVLALQVVIGGLTGLLTMLKYFSARC